MSDDRAKDVALAQKLAVRALSPTESGDKEALASYRKFCKLALEHEIKIDETCAGIAAAGADARAWTVEDFMRAAAKAQDILAVGKAALADPEVQKTLSAAKDLGSGIAKAWGMIRGRVNG